jgi:uncharacterized protein (TIGR03000 family)
MRHLSAALLGGCVFVASGPSADAQVRQGGVAVGPRGGAAAGYRGPAVHAGAVAGPNGGRAAAFRTNPVARPAAVGRAYAAPITRGAVVTRPYVNAAAVRTYPRAYVGPNYVSRTVNNVNVNRYAVGVGRYGYPYARYGYGGYGGYYPSLYSGYYGGYGSYYPSGYGYGSYYPYDSGYGYGYGYSPGYYVGAGLTIANLARNLFGGYGYGYPSPYSVYDPGYVDDYAAVTPPVENRAVLPPPVEDAPPIADNTAVLRVTVPESAEVWLNGAKMSSTGRVRNYVTPKLEPGRAYAYELKATWTVDDRAGGTTRRVEVVPGRVTEVDLTRPEGSEAPAAPPRSGFGGGVRPF